MFKIFYDNNDRSILTTLKSKDILIRLDRVAGNDLSVFYFDFENSDLLKLYNEIFLYAFDIRDSLPFVLFFNLENNEPKDIIIKRLEYISEHFILTDISELLIKHTEETKNKNTTVLKLANFLKTVKKSGISTLIEILIKKIVEGSIN